MPLNASGAATVTTSSLTAGGGFLGNHYVTATYSGDGTHSAGSSTLVQKVHAKASATTVTSSPNPSTGGQPVTFTATVASVPPGSPVPTGMVTFLEGATVLAQVPLNASSTASFTTSNLFAGDHTITASYYSDTTLCLEQWHQDADGGWRSNPDSRCNSHAWHNTDSDPWHNADSDARHNSKSHFYSHAQPGAFNYTRCDAATGLPGPQPLDSDASSDW